MKRFFVYLFRWQLSTLILAPVVALFSNAWVAAFVANLIGGCIFYWVDRWIFNTRELSNEWNIKYGNCDECGLKNVRIYRLVRYKSYNKKNDIPKYRCESCSVKKEKEIYESYK